MALANAAKAAIAAARESNIPSLVDFFTGCTTVGLGSGVNESVELVTVGAADDDVAVREGVAVIVGVCAAVVCVAEADADEDCLADGAVLEARGVADTDALERAGDVVWGVVLLTGEDETGELDAPAVTVKAAVA